MRRLTFTPGTGLPARTVGAIKEEECQQQPSSMINQLS